jgi:hypothetical protein
VFAWWQKLDEIRGRSRWQLVGEEEVVPRMTCCVNANAVT